MSKINAGLKNSVLKANVHRCMLSEIRSFMIGEIGLKNYKDLIPGMSKFEKKMFLVYKVIII